MKIHSKNSILIKNGKDNENQILNYDYLKCIKCKLLIGCLIDDNFYFLKSKIKVKKEKEISCNLVSLKEELLNIFNDKLCDILKKTNINFSIYKNQIFKNSLDKFSSYKKKQFDITFIIHKIEGRVFLLGNNGYYNKIIEVLNLKYTNNIFFILLVKEYNEIENNKMIQELIINGGEKELKSFYDKNKIMFLDNYDLENNIKKNEHLFINLFEDLFYNYPILLKEEIDEKCEVEKEEQYIKDKNSIDDLVNYISNGGQNNFFGKCFN